jgi:hypothetical protein
MLTPYQLEISVFLAEKSVGSLANTRNAPSCGKAFSQAKEVGNCFR